MLAAAKKFSQIYFKVSNLQQVSIGSEIILVFNRPEAIIWTKLMA